MPCSVVLRPVNSGLHLSRICLRRIWRCGLAGSAHGNHQLRPGKMNNGADCASICPVSRGRVLTVELPKSRNFCPRPDRCRKQRGQFSDTLSRSQAGRDSIVPGTYSPNSLMLLPGGFRPDARDSSVLRHDNESCGRAAKRASSVGLRGLAYITSSAHIIVTCGCGRSLSRTVSPASTNPSRNTRMYQPVRRSS